jgi:ABC-type Mn2+/Zn2+ transport system ATPase subunit
MKRRHVARAAPQAQLVYMDEPTVGVDLQSRRILDTVLHRDETK